MPDNGLVMPEYGILGDNGFQNVVKMAIPLVIIYLYFNFLIYWKILHWWHNDNSQVTTLLAPWQLPVYNKWQFLALLQTLHRIGKLVFID